MPIRSVGLAGRCEDLGETVSAEAEETVSAKAEAGEDMKADREIAGETSGRTAATVASISDSLWWILEHAAQGCNAAATNRCSKTEPVQ